MKAWGMAAWLWVVPVLGGCTTVGSYHPLFTSKDPSVDLPLAGAWEGEKSDADLKDLTVTRVAEGQYTLSFTTDKENAPAVYKYDVTLCKLGNRIYYDATFGQITWKNTTIEEDDLVGPLTIHFLGMVSVEGDNAELRPLDGEWLDKALEDKKVQIPYEKERDVLLLTAKTEELQKFVLAYSENLEAFPTGKFHRRK